MKEIRVRDLREHTGTSLAARRVLYCRECGVTMPANRGDYFYASPDFLLKCCNRPMVLAVKKITYMPVIE